MGAPRARQAYRIQQAPPAQRVLPSQQARQAQEALPSQQAVPARPAAPASSVALPLRTQRAGRPTRTPRSSPTRISMCFASTPLPFPEISSHSCLGSPEAAAMLCSAVDDASSQSWHIWQLHRIRDVGRGRRHRGAAGKRGNRQRRATHARRDAACSARGIRHRHRSHPLAAASRRRHPLPATRRIPTAPRRLHQHAATTLRHRAGHRKTRPRLSPRQLAAQHPPRTSR